LVKLLYDWDWRGAAQELKWDTPLNPHGVEAFSCYLHFRDAVFRTSETEADPHDFGDLAGCFWEANNIRQ
jgi:hypothetical protein